MSSFANPVLPGSHPDPSICRVGEDYYLATSTFVLFPGVALHHSRDLVHWRPIGAALDRPSQLDLDGLPMTDGIYAPTLRHHDGVFYLICTVVDKGSGSNFLVTATDPAGDWSEPVWINDAPGFDPSLLFDDDGTVWYCGTFQPDPDAAPGRTTVWLQQIAVSTGTLVGERHLVWTGAAADARWAEGPHLYRIGDFVYLLAAEGGTEVNHAVVVARAPRATGPYVGCPANPVLTSRHLGSSAEVFGPGHADLVQTQDGEWWAVLLAARPSDGAWWGTSRETFLVAVTWESGWPVFVPGVGRVPLTLEGPSLPAHPSPTVPVRDDFDTLGPEWSFLRTPRSQWCSVSDSTLRLPARAATPYDMGNPSMVLRRVEQASWRASLDLAFTPNLSGDRAGLVLWVSDTDQLRLEYDGRVIVVVRRESSVEVRVAELLVGAGPVQLELEAAGRQCVVRAARRGEPWTDVAEVDLGFLGQLVNSYFFGLLVGPYATGSGVDSPSVAEVDWFDYSDRSQ